MVRQSPGAVKGFVAEYGLLWGRLAVKRAVSAHGRAPPHLSLRGVGRNTAKRIRTHTLLLRTRPPIDDEEEVGCADVDAAVEVGWLAAFTYCPFSDVAPALIALQRTSSRDP